MSVKVYPYYDGKSHSTKQLVRCPKCEHLCKSSTMRVHRCHGNHNGLADSRALKSEFARDGRFNASSKRSLDMRNERG